MLPDILDALRCPMCEGQFSSTANPSLTCVNGHTFDRARQGYINLLVGSDPGTGDSSDMLARRTAFLGAGHYAPIAEALPGSTPRADIEALPGADTKTLPAAGGLIVEVGAGTGYYLASVLDRSPQASGLALDVSKYAARRAARAHSRAEAIVADCWATLPLADASVDLLLDVFAPRNAAEFARVLRPTGRLAVVTPLPEHLVEIRESLGMLTVDGSKPERIRQSLEPLFVREQETEIHRTMVLDRASVADLVGMGPSARHVDPGAAIATLPERVTVTLAARLGVYTPRPVPAEEH